MAKISKDDLEHVAQLSRLELSEQEKTKFTEQMGSILTYFAKLDEVETSEVEQINQINGMENITSDDSIQEKWEREELLKNAPETEDGFIKVKAVFE